MSTSKGKFAELMAKNGYDPRREHPGITPRPLPVYLGRGEWGPPEAQATIRDSRVPDPDDDKGYGPEDDDSWMDGK